jgi:Family of unknown function (DUF6118)
MSNHSNQEDEDFRDPATRAFDALRDELTNVRKSVDALHAGIQQSRPYDYRRTLGEILSLQQSVNSELRTLKSHPAINITHEDYSHKIAREKDRLIAREKRELKETIDKLNNNSQQLEKYISREQDASSQIEMLIFTGFACILFGSIFAFSIVTFVARLAPESLKLPEHIASDVLGITMQEAGIRLIQKDNPDAWEFVKEGNRILNNNMDALKICKRESIATKKEIKCTVVIR